MKYVGFLSKRLLSLIIIFVAVCAVLAAGVTTMLATHVFSFAGFGHPVYDKAVIIDAGHGGPDGGAVGVDGVVEKNINLAISLDLKQLFLAAGFKVIMIRESDISVHDPGSDSIRQKKVTDIHNRFKTAQQNPSALYLSIHQNKFEDKQYCGTQVFYSKNNEDSKILAESIQSTVRSLLQPQNGREIKLSGKNIYILYHSKSPTVLVECGFLSNPEEAEKLQADDYQKKMAFAIFSGTLKFYASNSGGKNGAKS